MSPHPGFHDEGNPSWIPNYWDGKDVFILGSGPSLYGFDFNRLKGKKSIACVHTIDYSPHSEFMVMLDTSAYIGFRQKPGKGAPYHTIAPEGVCAPRGMLTPGRSVTRLKTGKKFSYDILNDGAYGRFSSGYYATSIAIAMGAARIFLLGHDACEHNGRMHFYDTMKVKKEWPRGAHDKYETFAHGWKAFAKVGNIYNCSDISKVDVFPKMSIDEALA